MARAAPQPRSAATGDREPLRLVACGSVDDGKSTLIGRLLAETRSVPDDQLEALARLSRRYGTTGDDLDYALLLDGLEAEREQGITIDVAYRYFSTERRSFVVADTPGHQQYTRNMVVGASNAELAILLVDVRHGLTTQTKRHSRIAALLGIRHMVLAVNKMDLVGFSQAPFDAIQREFAEFAAPLGVSTIAIPVAARYGDNVASRSSRMPWHAGPPLLDVLEAMEIPPVAPAAPLRFLVQMVTRAGGSSRLRRIGGVGRARPRRCVAVARSGAADNRRASSPSTATSIAPKPAGP